jgi:hypothetical protein
MSARCREQLIISYIIRKWCKNYGGQAPASQKNKEFTFSFADVHFTRACLRCEVERSCWKIVTKKFNNLFGFSGTYLHTMAMHIKLTALQCINSRNLTPWRDSNPGSSVGGQDDHCTVPPGPKCKLQMDWKIVHNFLYPTSYWSHDTQWRERYLCCAICT